MQRSIVAALLAVGFLAPRVSEASVIYSYLGNTFATIVDEPLPAGTYDTGMRIQGWLELAAPLAPNLVDEPFDGSVLAFSFNDGRQTIETGVGHHISIVFSTDGAGTILDWVFGVRVVPNPVNAGDLGGSITSIGSPAFDTVMTAVCLTPGPSGCMLGSDRASRSGARGVWTLVPEPSTAALMGLGALVLGWSRTRHPRE
jgi:hypothetical protein